MFRISLLLLLVVILCPFAQASNPANANAATVELTSPEMRSVCNHAKQHWLLYGIGGEAPCHYVLDAATEAWIAKETSCSSKTQKLLSSVGMKCATRSDITISPGTYLEVHVCTDPQNLVCADLVLPTDQALALLRKASSNPSAPIDAISDTTSKPSGFDDSTGVDQRSPASPTESGTIR